MQHSLKQRVRSRSGRLTLEDLRRSKTDLARIRDTLGVKKRIPVYFPFEISARPVRPLQGYLALASELYCNVQKHYRVVMEQSRDWAQATLDAILSLDLLQVKIQKPSGVSAKTVMLPLHPLHLWRYQRLGEVVRGKASPVSVDGYFIPLGANVPISVPVIKRARASSSLDN